MKKTHKFAWVDASKKLPKEGRYVLIHLIKDNWEDSSDPRGVYYDVAQLRRGVSAAEREKMKSGEIPDPPSSIEFWGVSSKRSDTFTGADEWANNLRPYQWETFGASTYFGQEVDYWAEIPRLT